MDTRIIITDDQRYPLLISFRDDCRRKVTELLAEPNGAEQYATLSRTTGNPFLRTEADDAAWDDLFAVLAARGHDPRDLYNQSVEQLQTIANH